MTGITQRICWLFCFSLSLPSGVAFAENDDPRSEWPMFGQNEQNTASNDEERKISTSNVARLAPKWVATTGGDVSALNAAVRLLPHLIEAKNRIVQRLPPAARPRVR